MTDIFDPVAAVPADHALVTIDYDGQQGDLPDPIPFNTPDPDVIRIAQEAWRGGLVMGVPADPNANLANYLVKRFPANEANPNRMSVRPDTPFGTD